MAGKKKWLKSATSDKGALHRNLDIPAGEKIPLTTLKAATHSKNPTIRKEAALAETMRGFHHGGAKPKRSGADARRAMYGTK